MSSRAVALPPLTGSRLSVNGAGREGRTHELRREGLRGEICRREPELAAPPAEPRADGAAEADGRALEREQRRHLGARQQRRREAFVRLSRDCSSEGNLMQ